MNRDANGYPDVSPIPENMEAFHVIIEDSWDVLAVRYCVVGLNYVYESNSIGDSNETA